MVFWLHFRVLGCPVGTIFDDLGNMLGDLGLKLGASRQDVGAKMPKVSQATQEGLTHSPPNPSGQW